MSLLRRIRDWRPARPDQLGLLVMAVADRCDQRCLHCSIWQGPGGARSLTLDERLRVADEALAAGARTALLTGGEPLLSADLWPVAERLRVGGARLLLATNGMQLERWAPRVAALFDEVYLSLDGAGAVTHDAARGAAAFERVRAGVQALRRLSPRTRVVTRTTLHALNVGELEAIVEAARDLGAHHASFLPLDASSAAFGGVPAGRANLVPGPDQVEELLAAVDRLAAKGVLTAEPSGGPPFVLESAQRLRELAAHLRASGGLGHFERPRCDAPWWSVVVEADGALRPCFFQDAAGDVREGLQAVRQSAGYVQALRDIRSTNEVCERCVCPKWRGPHAARGN
jgi:Fe-coproporphyrin III synthase